jgi:four helix bundle protein
VTIRQFEDIDGWQEARILAAKIYEASNRGKFTADFGLRDQIRRASVSIMANIAEGFGRGVRPSFCASFTSPRASAIETQSHLYIAVDLGYLTAEEFETLRNQTIAVTRLVGGFINYLSTHTEPNNRITDQPNNG